MVKNSPASEGGSRDVGSIPGSGRFPWGGNSNLLRNPCPENSMDREAWQATVHRVTESDMSEWLNIHTHIEKFWKKIRQSCYSVTLWVWDWLSQWVKKSFNFLFSTLKYCLNFVSRNIYHVKFSRQVYWSGLPLPSPIIIYDSSSKSYFFFFPDILLYLEISLLQRKKNSF